MTKKIWGWIIGVVAIVVVVFYIVFNKAGAPTPSITMTGDGTAPAPTPMPTSSSTSSGANATSSGSSGTASAGGYKDGTYTGTVTNAIYGQIEVVATIQGGKLIDTECPIQPNAPGHTSQVSASALPQLKQEAIAAQSANINTVSGATQTSQAYEQSLAAALAQAQS